jgi:methyltransferase FkbM-like protein
MSRVAGVVGIGDAPIVGRVAAAATTLDGLLDRYGPPDFAKVDIEGAELVALECAPRFLESGPSILCDLHGTESVERVPALLRRARYDVEFVQPSCVLARPEAGSR